MLPINCAVLIDDDHITNYLNIIDKLGICRKVVVTKDAIEALYFIKNYCHDTSICPELIVLDLNMPLFNGLDFLDGYQRIEIPNKGKVRIVISLPPAIPQIWKTFHSTTYTLFLTNHLRQKS